ncbi:hypothetical protein Tco_1270603 [Tanacetum coccineum]
MRPSEIHKFCDATLRRTLEGLKSYYNDVKCGYVQKELTNDELEFLKLFEEDIEVRLKYRDQMRRWEMNKKDKRGIVIKNKAKLVAQGYTQCSKRRAFAPPRREASPPCYEMDLGVGSGHGVG